MSPSGDGAGAGADRPGPGAAGDCAGAGAAGDDAGAGAAGDRQGAGGPPALQAPLRLSIPTRIFLAHAFVVLALVVVAGTSLMQHARTAQAIRLTREGYLPLTLTLAEAKAAHASMLGQLESSIQGRGGAVARRFSIGAFQRIRPVTERRIFHWLERSERFAMEPADHVFLRDLRLELEATREEADVLEEPYETLLAAFEAGDEILAAEIASELASGEREIQRSYLRSWRHMQERMATTGAELAEQERQAAILLAILSTLGILLGAVAAWFSHRLLRPLPALHARVAAVARGDLEPRPPPGGVDELRRLAHAFEGMVDSLRDADAAQRRLRHTERLAAIGRIAAHVTHEVRNPLSSIGLNVEMLYDELGEEAVEARALMRSIQEEIDRLAGITEEYLRLARLPDPRLEPDDLGELVLSVLELLAPEMRAAGIEVDLQMPEELPAIAMDEPQLRQAWLNLLRNAREAMPEGGRITLRLSTQDQGVQIAVEDEGAGIAPEERAQLFDLFFTTKETGTGLGLPLTQQIIAAHGGWIRCEAREIGGTRFVFWLPAAREGAIKGGTRGSPRERG
ncbi:MAG: ATP-binding protein [Myxococcales bacterium]|nr:ATP-binding protein [Myxococcales bacterium]